MPGEAQLMFVSCTDGRFSSSPVLAAVPSRGCCGVDLNPPVPQPSLSSTTLLQCPSDGSSAAFSAGHWRWGDLCSLEFLCSRHQNPFYILQGQFRNQQHQDKDIPQLSVAYEKKTHNGYKNERTPIPMDFISLPPTSLTPVSISGVSRGGAS